jgi:hypothetical protein
MLHVLVLLLAVFLLLGLATRRSPRLSRILGSAGYQLMFLLRWLAIAFAMGINIASCAAVGLPAMILYLVIIKSYNGIKSLLRSWIEACQQPKHRVIHVENARIEEGPCGEDEVWVVTVDEADAKEGWTKYTLPETDDISELNLHVPNAVGPREGDWEVRAMFNRTDADNERMIYGWMGVKVLLREGDGGVDPAAELGLQEQRTENVRGQCGHWRRGD